MPIDMTSVRDALANDLQRGTTDLAQLVSRYANNRDLVSRTVLFKRRLSRLDTRPSDDDHAEALRILDDLETDQRTFDESHAESRDAKVQNARTRSLEITKPNAVVLKCDGLHKSFKRGGFALQNVALEIREGEIAGIVG